MEQRSECVNVFFSLTSNSDRLSLLSSHYVICALLFIPLFLCTLLSRSSLGGLSQYDYVFGDLRSLSFHPFPVSFRLYPGRLSLKPLASRGINQSSFLHVHHPRKTAAIHKDTKHITLIEICATNVTVCSQKTNPYFVSLSFCLAAFLKLCPSSARWGPLTDILVLYIKKRKRTDKRLTKNMHFFYEGILAWMKYFTLEKLSRSRRKPGLTERRTRRRSKLALSRRRAFIVITCWANNKIWPPHLKHPLGAVSQPLFAECQAWRQLTRSWLSVPLDILVPTQWRWGKKGRENNIFQRVILCLKKNSVSYQASYDRMLTLAYVPGSSENLIFSLLTFQNWLTEWLVVFAVIPKQIA